MGYQNACLRTLNISWNNIGDEGVNAISDALMANTTLESLNLGWNRITTTGRRNICCMTGPPPATPPGWAHRVALSLSSIFIGVKKLAEVLKSYNNTLSSLYLQHNAITPEGAIALAEALRVNTNLTLLNLEHNLIGNDGACALGNTHNISLTALDVGWNAIGDKGACTIAEALKTNTSISLLNLGWNAYIGDEGAKALAEGYATIPRCLDRLLAFYCPSSFITSFVFLPIVRCLEGI